MTENDDGQGKGVPLSPGLKLAVAAFGLLAVGTLLLAAFWLALFLTVTTATLLAGRAILLFKDRVIPDQWAEHGAAIVPRDKGAARPEEEIVIAAESIPVKPERDDRASRFG